MPKTRTDAAQRPPRRNKAPYLAKLGPYEIRPVPGTRNLGRFWYDEGVGKVRSRTLGTPDLAEAERELAKIVLGKGLDPDGAAGNPRADVVVLRYLDEAKKHANWPGEDRALLRALAVAAPDVTVSDLYDEDIQKAVIDHLATHLSPKSIVNPMALLSAAINWACRKRNKATGQMVSLHRPKIITSGKAIAAHLNKPAPQPRNWCPELDQMAAFLAAVAAEAAERPLNRYGRVSRAERLRRWCVLALAFDCRAGDPCWAKREELELRFGGAVFHLCPPHRAQTNKYRPSLPVPRNALAEILSWPEEVWVRTKLKRIQEDFVRLRKKLGLDRLVPGSFRHFMATMLRVAHRWFGAERVPEELVSRWMGHIQPTTTELYGLFLPDYLAEPRLATEAVLEALDHQSGGALFLHRRQNTQDSPKPVALPLGDPPPRVVCDAGTDSVFPRGDAGLTRLQSGEIGQFRAIPGPNHRSFTEAPETLLGGWQDDVAKLIEVSEGHLLTVAGMSGSFQQVIDKPFCRLDDIFEPTLGDLIQASGSQAFRFVPNDPGSLVSSPILFVQDQRHLIEG